MIVIMNMKMPKSCDDCSLCDSELWCLPLTTPVNWDWQKRPDFCPLTSIDDNALKLAEMLKEAGLTSEYVKDLAADLEGLRRGFVHRLAEKAKAAIDAGILYGVHSNPEDAHREDFGGSR